MYTEAFAYNMMVNYPLSKANGLPASQTSFLRSTPVGAEQTSTGCFAPYYLHRRKFGQSLPYIVILLMLFVVIPPPVYFLQR